MIQAKVIEVPKGIGVENIINPYFDPGLLSYAQESLMSLQNKLTDIGQSFLNKTQELLNFYQSNDIINQVKDTIIKTGNVNQNSIHYVDCNNINQAGLVMAGWIMSNPVLWNLYQSFAISGYDDSFRLDNPNDIEDMYRRVIDGVVEVNDEGWEVNFYGAENDLTTRQQVTILDAWDCALEFINEGKDPTSENFQDL